MAIVKHGEKVKFTDGEIDTLKKAYKILESVEDEYLKVNSCGSGLADTLSYIYFLLTVVCGVDLSEVCENG